VIIVEVDVVAVAFQSQSPFPTVSIPTMHFVDHLTGNSPVDSDHCSASDMQFYDIILYGNWLVLPPPMQQSRYDPSHHYMATLVDAQGDQLNDIEQQVGKASSFIHRGTQQLQVAKNHQRGTRKWCCIAVVLVIILLLIVAIPLLKSAGVL
jgi:hypothetical protein